MYRSHIAMFRVCCFLLFLVPDTRQLRITNFSVPQTVEVGQNAELQCEYDLKPEESKKVIFVKWFWKPFGEDKKQLYQRNVGLPAESTQHVIETEIKENDTLVLRNVQPSASGSYECEVSIIDEVRRAQQLIVYSKGSGPRLNVTVVKNDSQEGVAKDEVSLECEASDVAPLPELVITVNEKVINASNAIKKSGEDNFYYVFSNATLDKNLVNGGTVTCELYYKDLNITDDYLKDVKYFYDKPAADELTSTQVPEDTVDKSASTSVSFNNSSDAGSHLYTSIFSLFPVIVLGNLLS